LSPGEPPGIGPRVTVFETERLTVRTASPEDADLYFGLWTDPRVMSNVGFPKGLPIARGEVRARLARQSGSEFDRLLVVVLRATGEAIGECMMHLPDANGVARTDVKLLPGHWGRGYGVEVKRALLAHLFGRTDCVAVEATPNVGNAASVRMQEAVGGVRVGEAVHEFPESMRDFTAPVRHYVYRVDRSAWASRAAPADRGRAPADLIRGVIARAVRGARTVTRYREPIVAFVAADDPRFAALRALVDPSHLLPGDLLSGARSVVAYFLPFDPGVPASNARSRTEVSREWALAYSETNALLARIASDLARELAAAGVRAGSVPPTGVFDRATLRSSWSHKSAAVIAGLGSFGVHRMVITDSGCAGRFGSIVVDADLPVSTVPAVERCAHLRDGSCLACVRLCPVGALDEEGGLDRRACWNRCLQTARTPDGQGAQACGKCATGPCATGVPAGSRPADPPARGPSCDSP
jgi:epoxyqueuosine reductase QueG/RimJ/RimL family protein N-acetyltransferase